MGLALSLLSCDPGWHQFSDNYYRYFGQWLIRIKQWGPASREEAINSEKKRQVKTNKCSVCCVKVELWYIKGHDRFLKYGWKHQTWKNLSPSSQIKYVGAIKQIMLTINYLFKIYLHENNVDCSYYVPIQSNSYFIKVGESANMNLILCLWRGEE